MNLETWIKNAENLLENADKRLELALIIEKVLDLNSTMQRLKNPELRQEELDKLEAILSRRVSGEPLAYILGERAFFDLNLKVNNSTLIPRPETEILVEEALKLIPEDFWGNLADLGTGTGAIALVLAKYRPNSLIFAVDISEKALEIAKTNAKNNNLTNIVFLNSFWLDELKDNDFFLIASNPPYIDKNSPYLKDLQFEPQSALISENKGLKDLFYLIDNSHKKLIKDGFLVLEHGFDQREILINYAKQNTNWKIFKAIKDYADLDRVLILQKK